MYICRAFYDIYIIYISEKGRKHNTQESQEVSFFPAGDHKASRNGQDSITKTIIERIQKRRTALERSIKQLLEGLNMFNSTNLNIMSVVDQDILMLGPHERSLTYHCIVS